MFRLIREQKAKVTKVLSANVKSSTSNGYVFNPEHDLLS